MSRKRKKAKARTQRTPSTKQVAHFTDLEEAFFAAGMALETAPEAYIEEERTFEGPGLISRMLSRLIVRLAIRQRVAT